MYNSKNINLQLDHLKSVIEKIQSNSTTYTDTIRSHKSSQTLTVKTDIDWVAYAIKICKKKYKNRIITITYKNGSTKKKKLNSLTYANGEYDPKLDSVYISTIQYTITKMTP